MEACPAGGNSERCYSHHAWQQSSLSPGRKGFQSEGYKGCPHPVKKQRSPECRAPPLKMEGCQGADLQTQSPQNKGWYCQSSESQQQELPSGLWRASAGYQTTYLVVLELVAEISL